MLKLIPLPQDLYTPEVSLQDVALPDDHRQLLLNTFHSFDQFQKVSSSHERSSDKALSSLSPSFCL